VKVSEVPLIYFQPIPKIGSKIQSPKKDYSTISMVDLLLVYGGLKGKWVLHQGPPLKGFVLRSTVV